MLLHCEQKVLCLSLNGRIDNKGREHKRPNVQQEKWTQSIIAPIVITAKKDGSIKLAMEARHWPDLNHLFPSLSQSCLENVSLQDHITTFSNLFLRLIYSKYVKGSFPNPVSVLVKRPTKSLGLVTVEDQLVLFKKKFYLKEKDKISSTQWLVCRTRNASGIASSQLFYFRCSA